MTVRSTTQSRQANERRWLEELYSRWPVQEEQSDINYIRLAEEIGATPAPFQKAVTVYKEIGALITRLTYERGRHSFWTLAIPREEALTRLDTYHQRELTTMTEPKQNETKLVASVGEDVTVRPFEKLKPLRRDEEEALVAAARQYISRKEMLQSTLDQLERAGIKANKEAFEFQSDPRLEHISLVLPVIDRMKNQVAALEDRIEAYTRQQQPLRERIEQLETENLGLRRIVERTTSDRVPATARVTASE